MYQLITKSWGLSPAGLPVRLMHLVADSTNDALPTDFPEGSDCLFGDGTRKVFFGAQTGWVTVQGGGGGGGAVIDDGSISTASCWSSSKVQGELEGKADVGGEYPTLTAGTALGLKGRQNDAVGARYGGLRTVGGDKDVGSGQAKALRFLGSAVVMKQMVDTSGSGGTNHGVTFTNNGDGSWTVNGLADGDAYIAVQSFNRVEGRKYYMCGCPAGGSASGYYVGMYGISEKDTGEGAVFSGASSGANLNIYVKSGTTVDGIVFRPQLFDLTRMFGEGNEPSTAEEFRRLFPSTFYPYNAGQLIPMTAHKLRTVGFNAFDKSTAQDGKIVNGNGDVVVRQGCSCSDFIAVVPGASYYVKAGTSISSFAYRLLGYDSEKRFVKRLSVSGGIYTIPAGVRYVRINMYTEDKNDLCLNLSWSGYRNGEYEPYAAYEKELPILTYFPDGMMSDGVRYDELTPNKAIRRLQKLVLDGTEDWKIDSGSATVGTRYFYLKLGDRGLLETGGGICPSYEMKTVVTGNTEIGFNFVDSPDYDASVLCIRPSGTNYATVESWKAHLAELCAGGKPLVFWYVLQTPVETAISPDLDFAYTVDDFGTEEAVSEGLSSPIRYEVVYALNAVDTLRNLPKNYMNVASLENFCTALGGALGKSITFVYDAEDAVYDFTVEDAPTLTGFFGFAPKEEEPEEIAEEEPEEPEENAEKEPEEPESEEIAEEEHEEPEEPEESEEEHGQTDL